MSPWQLDLCGGFTAPGSDAATAHSGRQLLLNRVCGGYYTITIIRKPPKLSRELFIRPLPYSIKPLFWLVRLEPNPAVLTLSRRRPSSPLAAFSRFP